MYDHTNQILKSEIDYRALRIRSGLAGPKGRRTRLPRVRRPVVDGDIVR